MDTKRYIDKETLLIWLENMCVSEYIRKCINDNNKFQPANVRESVHAIWEYHEDNYFCSKCHVGNESSYTGEPIDSRYFHYCPNCGAIMDNYINKE